MQSGCALPPCLTPTKPLTLAEVQERFERQAVRGVCDTGRYRCSYYIWGEGPPLLLVPGMSERGHCFLFLVALLSGDFQCISYDMPLGGPDGARLSRYRHDDLVADALALLDHLGVRQSYLYGASFGSTIVLRLLHDHPGRFPRAVLQGGFARRPLSPAERLLSGVARYWGGVMQQLPLYRPLRRWANYHAFASRPPEVWDFFLEDRRPIAAVARHALLVHKTDLRPLLPQIRQPVLLVGGDHDPVVSRACEEALLQGLPSAGRIELAGCGHYPHLTHPEALAEVVRQFLTPPAPDALPCGPRLNAASPLARGAASC